MGNNWEVFATSNRIFAHELKSLATKPSKGSITLKLKIKPLLLRGYVGTIL